MNNLDNLLKSLESDLGLEKSASAQSTTKETPNISIELSGLLEKKAEVDLLKQAQDEGEELAKELIEKFASQMTSPITVSADIEKVAAEQIITTPTKENDEMKKLAELIMEKLAETSVDALPVANEFQTVNAAIVADDDSKVQPTPGNDGTVNSILQAIVAGAAAGGAGSDDLMDATVAKEGSGAIDKAAEFGSPEDEQEKIAALVALTDAGMDFNSAVDLVKQAEEALVGEDMEIQKIAAMSELLESGVDFDSAVALIKEAGEDGEAYKATAKSFGRGLLESIGGSIVGGGIGAGASALAAKLRGKGKVGEAAAIAAGAMGSTIGAYAGGIHGTKASIKNTIAKVRHENEKEAAMAELLEAGVDFDSAVQLIKQACESL